MEIRITIKPGVSPMDRGHIEDLLTSTIEARLGGSAECIGGGTLMGEVPESDFDLEFDGEDAGGVAALCREVLAEVPFTQTTVLTVTVETLSPFEVRVVGSDG